MNGAALPRAHSDPATVNKIAAADDIATIPNNANKPSRKSKAVAKSRTAVPNTDDENGTISRNGIALPHRRQNT